MNKTLSATLAVGIAGVALSSGSAGAQAASATSALDTDTTNADAGSSFAALTQTEASATAAAGGVRKRWYSCSAGGFTGTVQVEGWFPSGSKNATKIYQLAYKITKGSNSGGNKANVDWADNSRVPTYWVSTDAGHQTGKYRYLPNKIYRRGGGPASINFVFDKSRADDPDCGVQVFSR